MGIFLKALRDTACVDGFALSRCYERFYRVLPGIAGLDVSVLIIQILYEIAGNWRISILIVGS
ncbi:MAG: hypothetical protein F6K17_15380 [Okeania sp. SIO3C4]|nr:hypothetical protein [Okeania sp. SIO3C4]